MSSLGGRWPKKLRSLDGRFAFCAAVGLRRPPGEEGGSNAFSGSDTPRPLRILIELARFVFLEVVVDAGLELRSSDLRVRLRIKPYSRVGWSGAWQMERSSASVKGWAAKCNELRLFQTKGR